MNAQPIRPYRVPVLFHGMRDYMAAVIQHKTAWLDDEEICSAWVELMFYKRGVPLPEDFIWEEM